MFVCRDCACIVQKWLGQCPQCEAWNSFDEKEGDTKKSGAKKNTIMPTSKILNLSAYIDEISPKQKITSGLSECDRVLSGGFIDDAVVLVGGEPGIGKSTLTLQIAMHISTKKKVLYISGEESGQQVAQRLKRFDGKSSNIFFLYETSLEQILKTLESEKPDFVIIDSIQTVVSDELSGMSGSLAQVKYCADSLAQVAKGYGFLLFLIGHINKDGQVAGPKTLEHIVDTVLYLEGERSGTLRILRCFKNRFGVVDEIGIFEMTETGLTDVLNPTALVLQERNKTSVGNVLTCILEGNRGFLLEVQALTVSSNFGYPKRSANGIDANRLDLLVAVIQKYCQVDLSETDIYINIVGGIRSKDRSLDLAIIAAILSSIQNQAFSYHSVIMGEVGLSGEIRSSQFAEKRIKVLEQLLPQGNIIGRHDKIHQNISHVSSLKIG